MDRKGEWIQTFTGRQFWPLDPRPEDVCIEDIAHSLSLQCRFAGHTKQFYSVAQHSVLVARNVPKGVELRALLHNAAEAYLVDLPRPIKRSPELAAYEEIERAVLKVIIEAFWLPSVFPAVIKVVDDRMLATEARDLLAPPPVEWTDRSRPFRETIVPWAPAIAEQKYLEYFRMFWETDTNKELR